MKKEQKWPFDLFGVECGKGWEKLYQPLLDLCMLYEVEVLQVKEKFGGLRFYHGGSRSGRDIKGLEALVRAAESASYHTCEDCGEDGVEKHERLEVVGRGGFIPHTVYKAAVGGSGWIRTLCGPCRLTWEEKRNGKNRVQPPQRDEPQGPQGP